VAFSKDSVDLARQQTETENDVSLSFSSLCHSIRYLCALLFVTGFDV